MPWFYQKKNQNRVSGLVTPHLLPAPPTPLSWEVEVPPDVAEEDPIPLVEPPDVQRDSEDSPGDPLPMQLKLEFGDGPEINFNQKEICQGPLEIVCPLMSFLNR